MDALPAVLTISEAASELRITRQTAYAQIRAKTFPIRVVKVGSVLKVLRSDLERFLDGEPVAPFGAEAS
jgi:excisionase family DNA binding protein